MPAHANDEGPSDAHERAPWAGNAAHMVGPTPVNALLVPSAARIPNDPAKNWAKVLILRNRWARLVRQGSSNATR